MAAADQAAWGMLPNASGRSSQQPRYRIAASPGLQRRSASAGARRSRDIGVIVRASAATLAH